MKKKILQALVCVALAPLFVSCSTQTDSTANAKPSQKEIDDFTGKNVPPEWKNWKPGMPMPNGAKGPGATEQKK